MYHIKIYMLSMSSCVNGKLDLSTLTSHMNTYDLIFRDLGHWSFQLLTTDSLKEKNLDLFVKLLTVHLISFSTNHQITSWPRLSLWPPDHQCVSLRPQEVSSSV